MLIDSHAHIDDRRFNSDRDSIIRNMEKDGLKSIVNIGVDLQTSIDSVGLAEEHDNIYATVGVHPHNVRNMDDSTLEVLKAFAKRDKVVAIGETGLDFYRDNSPRDAQRKWFRKQLQLAKEVDLPVVIHSRDASEEVYNIIESEQDGTLRGVMHCFSESPEMAQKYLDLGFYISLSGTVTFNNARVPKEVAKMVPIDRLMIETDSPYLTPEPNRGKRNEPAYVRYVAGEVADLRGISYQELVKETTKNTERLFGIK